MMQVYVDVKATALEEAISCEWMESHYVCKV